MIMKSYKILKQQIWKAFETIESRLEKLKTALAEKMIENYKLGFCKSIELQRLEYTKVLSCLAAQPESWNHASE
jgi:hypothetical protein